MGIDPDRLDVETIWHAWCGWCEANSRKSGTKQTFRRDLRAALSSHGVSLGMSRPRDEQGDRYRAFARVTLRTLARGQEGRP